MSLSPAIWEKHANPYKVLEGVGAPPAVPLRIWKADGKILNYINERKQEALEGAAEARALAEQHNVSLMFIESYRQYHFFFKDVFDDEDERTVPEGFGSTGSSNGTYYLVSKDQDIEQALKKASEKVRRWLGLAQDVDSVAFHLRGDNLNFKDAYAVDSWKRTRDTIDIKMFNDHYYITTAANGADFPGCAEVSYADYLRIQAQHYAQTVQATAPVPKP